MKSVAILGSTGSIGVQSLDVCEKQGYNVTALTADTNVKKLEEQSRKWKPETVAMANERAAADLKLALADTDIKVYSGAEGVCECARMSGADTVINSIVGMAGLHPTLAVIESGAALALANKESLVAGGSLVTSSAEKNNVPILPVDSEHSAIFQCLQGKPTNKALKKIILTASGGPFFGMSEKELENVTAQQALKHPNWSMGAKITIDSATMFNKGLELIEAVWLFSVKPENVDIVVHRESIVHSLIEYDDNSVIAQLGLPDMRIPIQYALTYPERYPSPVGELDLAKIASLSFYKPDYDAFKCIGLCKKAIAEGCLRPAAVNAANEEANRLFREGKISFGMIPELISTAFDIRLDSSAYTLGDIDRTDAEARERVLSAV